MGITRLTPALKSKTKAPRLASFLATCVVTLATAASPIQVLAQVLAQDLEDTIGAELDGASPPPPETPKTSNQTAAKPSPNKPAPPKSGAGKKENSDTLLLDEGEPENASNQNLDEGLASDLQDDPDLQSPQDLKISKDKASKKNAQNLKKQKPPATAEMKAPPVQQQEAQPPTKEPPTEKQVENLSPPAAPPEPVSAEPPVVAGGANAPQTNSNDEPNLQFEKRIHDIFAHAAVISDEKWSSMLGKRSEETYAVQAGDTLWDISMTFFGDGLFWSKLWAQNGGIENPHLISPGKGIRFIAGTESDAPSMRVTETAVIAQNMAGGDSKGTATEPIEDPPIYEDQLAQVAGGSSDIDESEVVPRPEIPPARKSGKAPVQLPPSFQNSRYKFRGNFDKTGLDAPVAKAFTQSPTLVANSYLSEGNPPSIGVVDEIEMGEKYASLGQGIFLRLNQSVKVGERVSIVYVKSMLTESPEKTYGPIVEIGGRAQITEVIDSAKHVYKAAITYLVSPIRLGSLVTSDALPEVVVNSSGPRSSVRARVIGAEFDDDRRVIGESSIVYINGGTQAGIHNGDILAVQSRRGTRREFTLYPEYHKSIAVIKVIRALGRVATAIVLSADDEVHVGDVTGGSMPALPSALKSESPPPIDNQRVSF